MQTFSVYTEMRDAMDGDISHIQFNKSSSGVEYTFQAGGQPYVVNFDGPYPESEGVQVPAGNGAYSIKNIPISKNGWVLSFSAPHGRELAHGTGSIGVSVYSEVMKAVRRMVEQYRPDILRFQGDQPEQDAIYDQLYRRYMSKFFTKVTFGKYFRNDFLAQIQHQNPEAWENIQKDMGKPDRFTDYAKEVRERTKKRRAMRAGLRT